MEDQESIKAILLRMNQATIDGDLDTVESCCAEHHFMLSRNNSGDPLDWNAELFDPGLDKLRQGWTDTQAAQYRNEIKFLKIDVQNDLALAITSETGSTTYGPWEDRISTWIVGRVDAECKILGLVTQFRDA
jgi:hypothetical protein